MAQVGQQGQEGIGNALESLKNAYRAIIQNETLHRELSRSSMSPSDWRDIDIVLDFADSNRSTYDLFSLYQGIASMLAFGRVLSTEVRQSLRSQLTVARRQGAASSRAMLEMTVANLDSNVKLLLDRLGDLYALVSQLDEDQNGRAAKVGARFPELAVPDSWAVE